MINLKHFNESTDFYQEIEGIDYISSSKDYISQSDWKKILKSIQIYFTAPGTFYFNDIFTFYVTKNDDEYYYVKCLKYRQASLYYKCDQIDGVIKLLHDLK